jgi:pimeloyl-ACP methyl ester carboxylesterase
MLTLSTGVRVRVAENGPSDGRPVLMLHGWAASLYTYRHAFERLPPHGMRTIAVDLRGHGLSDKPAHAGAYGLDAYCADLDALLNALELPAADLIGQSMGGGLALRFALTRPERTRTLALINPTGLVRIAGRNALLVLPRSLVGAIGRRLVPRWSVELILRYIAYADSVKVEDAVVDQYWSSTQLPGYVYAVRSALAEFDWRPLSDAEAEALTVPTVVILGTRDRLIPNTDRAARRLRGSSLSRMTGGHCVHEESPAEVYGLISRFLIGSS